ncbi:Glutamine dumper [Thalictrum thalictroides]|uniref:Glutamine dumper n=1 Tax=Thalictrum thalictroides TaxID=46969 RepID=A0A7J6WEW3_THATH|nr:Glutamine dumper [Thalictrum thalictroides]
MRTLQTTTLTPSSSPDSLARVPHSPWHSPVPYLFGGLAAMLGLIAFALLILACSYWKLSGNFDNEEESERDLENGDEKNGDGTMKAPPVYEEKIVVIMAGDCKPTYLATPMSSRASSFGSNYEKETENSEKSEKPKQDIKQEDEQQQETENRAIPQSTTTTTTTTTTQENPLQDQQV